MKRRTVVAAGLLALAARAADAQPAAPILRTIPSSGETVLPVGLGTAVRWDGAADDAAFAPLRATVAALLASGGSVIDTANNYGDAQTLVGRIAADLRARDRLFIATKILAEGRAEGERQLAENFARLQTGRIDLVAVHNLADTATQLPLLREAKAAGRVRYVGATTSFERQHGALEQLMRTERLDFIQVDFALDNRAAAARILPTAAERGVAVMVNLPFGRNRLFAAVRGKPLPEWAAELRCATWAQLFLKYILSFEAVTCAVPGMSRPEYPPDNLGAAHGPLPDGAMRARMEQFIDSI